MLDAITRKDIVFAYRELARHCAIYPHWFVRSLSRSLLIEADKIERKVDLESARGDYLRSRSRRRMAALRERQKMERMPPPSHPDVL